MTTAAEEYCFLTMTSGARPGTHFLLKPDQPNRIGRGSDCEVQLSDPGSSRVHAIIERDAQGWWVEDLGSRNGTFRNEQPVKRESLQVGDRVRVATSELEFCRSEEPPTVTAARAPNKLPHVIHHAVVDADDSGQWLLRSLENAEFAHDLLVIYQLSVKLLEYNEPDPVIQTSLELLHERSKASVVGFLWVTDDGLLRPKLILPDATQDISLHQDLSDVVLEEGRAIWISHRGSGEERPKLRRYSDAICAPLVKNQMTLGVIHMYLKQGRFRQADFDFAISVANLMAVSLVRTRKAVALQVDHQRLANQVADFRELIGRDARMRDLKQKVARIAGAKGCVLIRGESGSGKELVARAIHAAGPRSERPLLSVNCAAIPPDLIESQLFGHKKGAFTGADQDHRGYFQQADTGSLFLDEIGELPLEGQAKLLRILEGHPFSPVGASEDVLVDVRVIAATNRDLKEFVRQRRFRQDLYFRLSVYDLELPPLRERGDDIGLLIDHFFNHFRRLHGRPHLKLSSEARERLLGYSWPGNVRQLRNVIDSAVVLAESETITLGDLGIHAASMTDRPSSLNLVEWERSLIQDALTRTRGRIPEAAKLLGIGRATLYRKIDEYKIDR